MPKEHRPKALKYMQKQVERSLGDIRKIPLNILSAKTGFKVDDIMDQVLQLYEKWNIRISTGILNNWLSNFKKIQNLPNEDGDKLKIRFMSQVKNFFIYIFIEQKTKVSFYLIKLKFFFHLIDKIQTSYLCGFCE